MQKLKRILTYGIIIYFIYIFLGSFVVYSFHSSAHENKVPLSSRKHTNDQVVLIESPDDAISARLSLIENAESELDIAYYRWNDGKVSDLLFGPILKAADNGVQVRILLDGILQLSNLGSRANKVFLGFQAHPNIELKLYEPFQPFTPIAWNHRMHDKMILVDNEFGLIGGRNIDDRFYLEDAHKDGLVKDREVLIYHNNHSSTTVLDDMQEYYEKLWNYQYSKAKYKRMTNRRIEKATKTLEEVRAGQTDYHRNFLTHYFPNLEVTDWTQATSSTNTTSFTTNPLGRGNKNPRVLNALSQLGEETEDNIFIQSPYVIPSQKMLATVDDYAVDAQKVTFFTNSKAASPNLVAMAAYTNHRSFLINQQASIFEYQGPGSIHGKSAIFDEKISAIGTFNIDPRSSFINTESMVVIDSPELAKTLRQEIGIDFNNSLELASDSSYVKSKKIAPVQLPFIKKLAIQLLSFVSPFFEKLL